MANEKFNILRLLIENQDEKFSIRQIAIKRKINYKSAYLAVHKLNSAGLVALEKHGNTTLCGFSRNFGSLVYDVEDSRRTVLLKNKDFKVIYDRLQPLPSQFILLLFGSYAKGTQKKHSDIDFLLVSDNPNPVEDKLRLVPLNIHMTAVSYSEFISMLKSKEFSVVSECVKKNIILFGIEDYYRLVKNAG